MHAVVFVAHLLELLLTAMHRGRNQHQMDTRTMHNNCRLCMNSAYISSDHQLRCGRCAVQTTAFMQARIASDSLQSQVGTITQELRLLAAGPLCIAVSHQIPACSSIQGVAGTCWHAAI